MPYAGIPPSKTKDMESCVLQVMDDPKMKSKYPDHDERKSHAVAICHKSIMGSKKMDMPSQVTFNINLNDYWKSRMEEEVEETEEEIEELEGIEGLEKKVWTTAFVNTLPDSSFAYVEPGEKDSEGKTVPRSKRHLPYKDASGKPDAAHIRNALARLNQTDIPADAKASAKAKLVAAAKQLGIEVSDENKIDAEGGDNIVAKKDIAKQDEVVEEVPVTEEAEGAKTPAEEVVEEKPAEEAVVEEAPAEEAVVEEVPAEEAPAEGGKTPTEEAPAEEVAVADPVGDLLKQVLAKVDEIQTSIKKEEEVSVETTEESAPAEGATPSEEAPKEEVVVETPVEESPAPIESEPTGASTEGTEEVAKIIASLEKRINALEEQPAPSKVVSPKVVTKGEEVGGDNPNQSRLDEIKTELSKLEEMRDKDLNKYQNERAWEKAFNLIEERDNLLKG